MSAFSEDSRLAPLSGSMTKWDYMVVRWSIHGEAITTSGKKLSAAKWERDNRHEGLKELGEKGWELIKIRRESGGSYEWFYFKRPL